MEHQRNKKAKQEIQKLDKALREVRGVSLNQPLESGMMGGAVQRNNMHPDIQGLSSFNDPATLTAGAGMNQFKLPSITRNTQFSQNPQREQKDNMNNLINGSAATTHHHLNVTLGEEKFYYTAKNDEKIANQILQSVVNQSSISSIQVKTGKNDYVGLMTKKNKIGSVEFVQTGFAIGSNTFKPQNSADGQIDFKMMTIDPEINMKLGMDSRKGQREVKAKGQKQQNDQFRNNQNQEISQANYQIDIKNAGIDQTQKKGSRIENNSLNQYALGNIDQGDYGGNFINQKNIYDQDSQLISQSILNSPQNFNELIQANQNYEDQSAIGSQATGQTTQGPKSKHNRHQSLNLPLQNKANLQTVVQKIQSNQVSLLGNKNIIQKEPKVTEQVAYLLRQIQKKGQIFIPLEQVKDPNSSLVYKENKFQTESNACNVFFSKNGFVSLAKDNNQMTDFISNDQFIEDGVTNQILKEIPFFKKFQSLRLFMQWKTQMRQNAYERKRQKLSQNMIFARPVFSEKFKKLINEMNALSNLFLIEIQQNVVYGKKQPSTLEEKCKSVIDQNRIYMEAILTKVKDIMIELKNEILADDERFEDQIKEAKVAEILKNKHTKNQPVVQFHQQRKKTEAINEQYRLKKLRHQQYDQLLFLVFKFWSTKIVNLLFDSKKSFCDIYGDPKNYPQFEVSICFGPDGKLDSDPTMDEHLQSFKKVFEEMEHVIFKSQFLQFFMHDMNDLFFGKPSKYTKSIFENMKEVRDMNDQYKRNQKQIFDQLNEEVDQCKAVIEYYKPLQEIQSFCLPWTQGKKDRQVSMEIGAYKETLKKMNEFDKMIADVPPGNTKKGTILIETNTLKKQLIEMPRQVKDSIRQNVQQTMEQETKTLKEELSKTTEILDQLPTSLNTYVEQVNTLKYIEHKSEDFENKFLTIENLQQECRKDGLTVSSHLLRAIDEVRKLYHGLPELQKRSQEQLAQNKETMEKIMSSSSNVLSKKIKAFEKKYVETYLHDESRLNDCGDTLEELFKRSKAIHEIRSKVILYREFLKLLYEKDENPKLKMEQNKLSCADDFEILQEIHKHTIRLWKILLYWKKRRQMCYNTPFLNLDTQMIIKSIHKVMKYLEEKLPQHEFVQRQSRNICKTIQKQVKDTNLIIEFVKDLRRQSLQNRHWMQIFDLIKAPHLKTQNTFTIVDLSEYHIRDYEDDIHQIIDHANTESKYETIFQSICQEWEKLDLKIIPFKDTQNSYIMVNTETLNQAIEENLNTLEIVQQSEFATHIQTDIIAWIKKLKTMHQNLDVWIDAQRHWINLDIIYNSSLFQNVFGENTKKFIDTRLQFQRIMWSCYKNPQAIYNLMIDSRIKVFKEMTIHFKVLQLKVHEFLEQKRLVFSRFYFLNDSQFLEFLTLANTNQDFSIYINTLFVGAQTLYIQPADQVKIQLYEEGENKQISEEEDSQSSDENNQREKSGMNGLQSVENSKMGIIGVNDYQVLGMISQNKELFLFEQPVLIQNDDTRIREVEGYEISGTGTGNVEQWLIKVEQSMKETIQKQMQYAVKSFATRALDEWILDYPQQIVITTINLILSNEINDILEQKQREREAAEGSDDQEEEERDGSGAEVREGEQEGQKDDGALQEKSKAPNEQAPESAGRESIEEVPQVNKKSLKGAAVLKLSPDEQKIKLHQELFGLDFIPDGRFKKAIEQATEDIRQRKLQQQVQQTAGAAAQIPVKPVKRNQKRPEYKDFVMEVLGQQSFYGIYLRVQFWINKIIRSLTEEKKNDWQDKSIDFTLTGVQKMIMKNVILYLLHQRDSIDKLVTLEISDKNDFQWLSRIKILWTQTDSGPLQTEGPTIECGGWKQQLGAEYLGSQQRLPLSPLTDRYYVFMSSALREKSGVLFKCNNSHQHASDVFEEFAQQCHMAYKSFQCNQDMHVSQLMQVINGAAMANFWIFFEHLDNLPLVNFQIILKEIQMVQQQYIIAELGDLDLLAEGNIGNRPVHFSENKNGAKDDLIYQREGAGKIINNAMKINEQSKASLTKVPSNKVIQKLVGIQRPCLGIFGSLSNQIIIKNTEIAENLNLQAQSAFRSVSLAKPNMIYLIHMILKSEGYQCYKKLGDLVQRFLVDFTQNKNQNLFGDDAHNHDLMDQTTERLVLRDVKIAIKFATLLRDQEWQGYLEKIFNRQQKKWKFELQLYEKSITEKQTELIILDGQKKLIFKDKEHIDFETMREGLRLILKSKFFNEWRAVKQNQQKQPLKLNESEAEKELESLITETFNSIRDVQLEQEEALEKLRLEVIEKSKQAPDPLGKQVRRTMTQKNLPKRRLTHASTVELTYATTRQRDEEAFSKIIEDSMNKVVQAMKLRERPKQLYNCLGVIEYMRKQKGIALVGPVCSGKTQILKIVSQTLKVAYDVIFRTSAINPLTFSKEEFYGPINAFESLTQKDQEEALKKKNIFQIVLDNYYHEKMQLSTEQRKNYIQSFLIDSDKIDSYFMDSLIQFLQKSNLREREYYDDLEFILHLSAQGQAHDTVIQNLPITLPNGNIVMLPSDLYFFFETENISNASPLFLSQVGLVVTQDSDVEWQDLFFKNMMVYFTKHQILSQHPPHQLDIQTHFEECWKEFLNPMIDILDKNEQINQWPLWNLKSLVLQFFRILNSLTYRLEQACKLNLHNEDPMTFPIEEMKRDTIRSIIVCSFILSFGICLNTELQKIFEDTFSSFRKKFNMQINAQAVMRPTIFDIYFDVEKLSWEVIQEKLEYKLKLGYYPKMTTLLVPTPSIALSFFILEQLTNYLKFDNELDKNFRILGPQGTSKTVILNTFIQRQQENLDSIIIPMSGYLSFEMLRKVVESKYVAKRKKKFSPKNEFKKILIVIDDIHLQSNIKLNILEYFRTWTQSNGYFDVGAGIFKQITDFSIVMAQNSSYRIEKCNQVGRQPLKNRFLYYTNTQYIDEIPIEKFKPFIQHWLTSKMWSPNRLLKKYYIIITNGMMQLLERVKRSEPMQNSSFSSLSCFDLLARFCTSLVQNTVISDDHLEIGLKGQREEDSIANVVLYEVFRNYSDRIMKPQDRLLFTQKAIDIFRHEFQMRDAKVDYIDQLIMGNFHEKQVASYIKYVNFSEKKAKVKDIIIQKLTEKSNNHFLMSFLDTPNGVRDVFKLSRILFKEQQHLILCGSPSSQKYECLQIAAILNDAAILELNCPKFNEPIKFEESFKQALLTVIRLDNVNCFIVINDHQLRDPMYIDFVHNYLSYIGKDEECILMDEDFKKKVIEIEVDIFMKNKENFKYDKNKQPNHESCLKKSVEKLMKQAHIVLILNDLQTYYEWVSLFPGLESKCDVMFMEDLSSDGYKQVTKQFLERCKIDEDMEEEERTNLVKSMIYAKETVKAKIFENFYNADFLKNYSNEEYLNGQGVEYIYPNEKKNHFFLFDDGNFNVYDPILKQQNYNMRGEYILTMKQKYIMFLEVFRFFYDFLSLNLSIRKNYYETFIAKTDQFNNFFDEINSKKKDLHGASNHINYKMTMIQDKMNRIHKSIQDKQVSIQKRSMEIQDLKLQLRNQMEEVDQVLEDKNKKLNQILDEISKLNEKEITFINSAATEISKQEIGLLNVLAVILDKDDKSDTFEREIHGSYFHDVQELKDVLNERRHFGFNVLCFKKLKEYITKSQGNDFQKPVIYKLIFSFLSELYRKLNVRNTMQQQFSQIAEIKSSIDSNHFSINYSERYIKERKNELLVLENKNKRVKERDNKLVKKIEVAEISHMRTQHIFGSVKEYGQKINQKLDNINSRLQAILGDCIILATSICFLGIFSQEERIQVRSEIAKHISEVESINCSKDWILDAKNPNFRSNSKMFKSILKEYGLRKILLPHQHSGIITESVLCESIFHLIFAPSCPLVVDPTGEIQEFLRTKMISKLHIKQIYGSDLSINSQIQNTLKSHNGFALLNDVNNFEKASFGLCQDQSLLHRICESFYNGIDFNYDRSAIWKKIPGIEQNLLSSYNSLNKKMPVNEPDVENVSLYQVQLFSPSFDYQNGNLFMAKGSSFVAMSTNEEILKNPIGQNAWMEIKELLIEQINNHEWKQLQEIKGQIKFYDENKSHLNRAYENNFLVANHDTLQKIEEYTNLKQSIEDIENQLEERILYKRMYQEMIHKYEILTYYSKVILNMYLSLKTISKIMNEVTYSWKMFKQIIEQILRQIIAGLAQEAVAKKQKNPQNSSAAQSKTKSVIDDIKPQVDIDLKFFQRNFIPKLHKTFVSSVRQDSTAPLFNLILAVRISMLQEQVSIQESQFFLKQLLLLKDFQDWRKAEIDFVDMKSEISRTRILQLKRDISRLYPEFGKQFVEQMETDLGQTFQYKKASLHIFKLFKDQKFKNLTLMQEICLGFLCPDHEFKCKLTQFVYEQLTEVFDFTEEYSRLHQFLSRASWKHPIALLSVSHVNMINTISSIAQHYGVGLDVIRTDIESDKIIAESRVGINTKLDKLVKQNLLDQTAISMKTKEQRYQRLQTMATNYLKTGNICSDPQACLSKLNIIQNSLRQQFDNPDKQISENQEEDSERIIERAAKTGSWILISTIRFPQFWKRICNKLDQLREDKQIDDQFRLIFDLQGYNQSDISDAFIFDHSVAFHMTEQNTEEFQGFDDIWSAILDERVLIKLAEKIDNLEEQIVIKQNAKEDETKSDIGT